MVSKEDFTSKPTKTQFYLAEYGYSGKLKSNISLEANLGSKYFCIPKKGNIGYIAFKNKKGFGYTKVAVDNENNAAFLMGTYSDSRNSDWGKGFFVFKYDLDGNLIFKKTYSLGKIAKTMNFYFWGDNQLLLSSGEDYVIIDTKTGGLKTTKKDIRKNFGFNIKHMGKKEAMLFNPNFIQKKTYGKKLFNTQSSMAISLNPEIKTYLKNKDSKTYLYYDANFLKDGHIVLVEFDKKSRVFKYLLF